MKKLFCKFSFLSALALVALLTSCGEKTKKAEEPKGPAIIAYIDGSQSLDASKIQAGKVTHFNYAFASVKEGKASLENQATDVENLKILNGLKEENSALKVLISVAAREWSKSFADTPLTADAQKAFAKSVVDIMLANNLDGIDINWGYPTAKNPKDSLNNASLGQNYVKTIAAIREELNAQEKDSDKKYILSCAVETSPAYITNAGMKEAQQYLDYINVMAFNYQDEKVAINQAGLYPSDKYDIRSAASVTVEDYIKSGVSSEKLVLGIPFSGTVYQVKKNSLTGIGDPIVKKTDNKGYTYIKDSLVNKNEYFRYWDNVAQAPYVYNFYKSTLVTYDDEESVKAKCQYAIDNKMGGVMLWEYNSDTKGFLLNAVNQVLK